MAASAETPQNHQNPESATARLVAVRQSPKKRQAAPSGVNARTSRNQPTTLSKVSGFKSAAGPAAPARSTGCRPTPASLPLPEQMVGPSVPEQRRQQRRAGSEDLSGRRSRAMISHSGTSRNRR